MLCNKCYQKSTLRPVFICVLNELKTKRIMPNFKIIIFLQFFFITEK